MASALSPSQSFTPPTSPTPTYSSVGISLHPETFSSPLTDLLVATVSDANGPLCRIIVPPTVNLSLLSPETPPAPTKPAKPGKKSTLPPPVPWINNHSITACYNQYTKLIIASLDASLPKSPREIPTTLYASPHLGPTFPTPTPPTPYTVTTTRHACLPFHAVFPAVATHAALKAHHFTGVSGVAMKDAASRLRYDFVKATKDPCVDTHGGPTRTSLEKWEVRIEPAQGGERHGDGFRCVLCGKRGLVGLEAGASHLNTKHGQAESDDEEEDSTFVPLSHAITPEIWALNHPLLPYPAPYTPTPPPPQCYTTPVPYVYMDSHYVIIVKPQGLTTVNGARYTLGNSRLLEPYTWATQSHHKGWGTGLATSQRVGMVVPAMPAMGAGAPEDALGKATPVHRLDKATGGLVVCARTRAALSGSLELWKGVQKRYRAVVFGTVVGDKGEMNTPIDGKVSKSLWEVARRDGNVTTLLLWPVTGRTHQLRKHCAEMGHAIVGDSRYAKGYRGADGTGTGTGAHGKMCLFAVEVDFDHPFMDGERFKVSIDEPAFYEHVRAEVGGEEVRTGPSEHVVKKAKTHTHAPLAQNL